MTRNVIAVVLTVSARLGPPGYEVALLSLASLAALVKGGAGPLSIGAVRTFLQQPGRRGHQIDFEGLT
jgi:hypothetical protein